MALISFARLRRDLAWIFVSALVVNNFTFPGLKPRATNFRPYGAGSLPVEGMRLSQDVEVGDG